MAQFRNTADIFTEVLQKAGEPTNGNSDFQTVGLTYLNRAHHAIIGGGSIFNLNVDEPWVWARSRNPIILELQPVFNTGQAQITQGDINLYFSSAPSISLEGWNFQIYSGSTVYRITSHAAGSTAAQIDSSFIDSAGTYNFRAFKLDYQIFPAYLYVDNYSDKLDFAEVSIGTATSTTATRTASIPHGSYAPATYLTTVLAQMAIAGTASYGGAYDTIARTFNLTASNASFSFGLLGATGTNARRSCLPQLGFDRLDNTGTTSYTSVYAPNSIARLVEPFKIFTSNFERRHFINSTDPVKMQEDYPVSLTREAVPNLFTRIDEGADGSIWVRFNSYPKITTKCSLDWVPQPLDLQNNTASVPALPRGDIDALIHAAAAMVLYDKEDSKWETTLKLAEASLNAMKKKNHGALFRTSALFGQQQPRLDLNHQNRHLRYGYTVSASTASQTTGSSVQTNFSFNLSSSRWQTAGTVASVTVASLPSNMMLSSLILNLSQSFTGSAISAINLQVGVPANPSQFVNGFNPMQAPSATAQVSSISAYFPGTATPIVITLTSVGANLSALTQGALAIYLYEQVSNAPS